MPIDEMEQLLEKLPDAQPYGSGYRATCPVHKGAQPESLFIGRTKQGGIVLRCVNKCARAAVLSVLGTVVAVSASDADLRARARSAPWSKEAEEAVLGAILQDPVALSKAKAIIEPTHFYREAHRRIYNAFLDLDSAGKNWTDPIVLTEYLKQKELLHTVGGYEALGNLIDCVPTAANIEYHARIVADYAQQRTLISELTLNTQELIGGSLKVGDVQQKLRQVLDSIDASSQDATNSCIRLDELWADEELMRPPKFVVPFLVQRGRSTLFASAEKAGKSTMTGFFASMVTNGGEFLGEPCVRGDVIVVGLEEHRGNLARRLKHFNADGSRLWVIPELRGPTYTARVNEIRKQIEAKRPILVIIDTLMALIEGLSIDVNQAAEMQPIVQSLTKVAHLTNTGLVIVHHAKKDGGGYRDSSAIGGAVDAIAEMFAPEPDDDPTLRRIKRRGREIPGDPFDCYFDNHSYTLHRSGALTLEQKILKFVSQNPECTQQSVVRAMKGVRESAVKSTVKTLLDSSRLENTGTQSTWRLLIPGMKSAAQLSGDTTTQRGHSSEWAGELDF